MKPRDHINEDNRAEAMAEEANLHLEVRSADAVRLNKLMAECRRSQNPLLFQEISALQKHIKQQEKALVRGDKLNGEEIERDDPMFDQARKPGVNK